MISPVGSRLLSSSNIALNLCQNSSVKSFLTLRFTRTFALMPFSSHIFLAKSASFIVNKAILLDALLVLISGKKSLG